MSRYLDRFQITGFVISTAIAIGLVVAGLDALPSLLVGLTLAVLTQLFDIQARMMASVDNAESLIEERADRVIRSLDGVEVVPFAEPHEFYTYVARRIREAKRTVDDMTLGKGEGEFTLGGQEALEKYIETISSVCSRRKTVTYREIMSFPSAVHSKRAESVLEKKLPNYLLGWYRYKNDQALPLLQFMVIDSEEVILAFYQSPSEKTAKRPVQLAVRQPNIVELFQDYYNTMWRTLKVVRDIETFQRLESSHETQVGDSSSDQRDQPTASLRSDR